MIDPREFPALAAFAARHGVSHIEWKTKGRSVAMRLAPASPCEPGGPPGQPTPSVRPVTAPTFGVFLSAGPTGEPGRTLAPPFRTSLGEILGFLRVEEFLVPVRAPCSGTVWTMGAMHGGPIGYGDRLFEIEADEGESA